MGLPTTPSRAPARRVASAPEHKTKKAEKEDIFNHAGSFDKEPLEGDEENAQESPTLPTETVTMSIHSLCCYE